MSPELWTTLITALFAIVKDCRSQGETPEAIAERITNPRGRTLVKVERATRQTLGQSPRQWRKNPEKHAILAEVIGEMRGMSRTEALEFVEEAAGGDEDLSAVAAAASERIRRRGRLVEVGPGPYVSDGPRVEAFKMPRVDISLTGELATAVDAVVAAGNRLQEVVSRAAATVGAS
jgi:hypothetical protein